MQYDILSTIQATLSIFIRIFVTVCSMVVVVAVVTIVVAIKRPWKHHGGGHKTDEDGRPDLQPSVVPNHVLALKSALLLISTCPSEFRVTNDSERLCGFEWLQPRPRADFQRHHGVRRRQSEWPRHWVHQTGDESL